MIWLWGFSQKVVSKPVSDKTEEPRSIVLVFSGSSSGKKPQLCIGKISHCHLILIKTIKTVSMSLQILLIVDVVSHEYKMIIANTGADTKTFLCDNLQYDDGWSWSGCMQNTFSCWSQDKQMARISLEIIIIDGDTCSHWLISANLWLDVVLVTLILLGPYQQIYLSKVLISDT